ncbi:MAG TPA: aminotransferase class IV [Kiritimatiellia bacterium]|nr:aminotransferase class IV [Kiritimatiellia bacterium]HPJ56241.1 aminotransferase class IV [Kiritimatiellia bacterium]HPR68967.1 aminotransferase class IV [Kiritimatiellia bacterium]HRX05626.1 aminotransferase class IV [Kiritimatiellia bacterium]
MKTDFKVEDFAAFCRAHQPDYHANYYAMYSSWWNGITTEPNLMVVPVDDHMVHRGDGLFETFKCVDGAVYNLEAHLARLENGAKAIALQMPWSREDIRRIIGEVLKAGGRRDALIRIFVSRGPGGHSANPYECPEPLLMVLAIRLPPPFMASHPEGARVGMSAVPNKEGMFAQVKSVNYLPNVLMKKQAVDAGVDFMLGFDKDGHMTELPTENFGIVTAGRVLKVPRPDHILAGTTMGRVLALARDHLVPSGVLAGVAEADVPRAELEEAEEMLVFGTSPHVTAVTEFAGRPVGDGKPGPVWRELSRLFEADLKNPAMLTPVV